MQRVLCITNNPRWVTALPKGGLEFVDDTPLVVFQRARDLVHQGWKFLGHPLYGNFNPAKVPYRTLLLAGPSDETIQGAVDIESFAMLEKALEQFRALGLDNYIEADMPDLPENVLRDYEIVDYELMKETVARYIDRRQASFEGGKERLT